MGQPQVSLRHLAVLIRRLLLILGSFLFRLISKLVDQVSFRLGMKIMSQENNAKYLARGRQRNHIEPLQSFQLIGIEDNQAKELKKENCNALLIKDDVAFCAIVFRNNRKDLESNENFFSLNVNLGNYPKVEANENSNENFCNKQENKKEELPECVCPAAHSSTDLELIRLPANQSSSNVIQNTTSLNTERTSKHKSIVTPTGNGYNAPPESGEPTTPESQILDSDVKTNDIPELGDLGATPESQIFDFEVKIKDTPESGNITTPDKGDEIGEYTFSDFDGIKIPLLPPLFDGIDTLHSTAKFCSRGANNSVFSHATCLHKLVWLSLRKKDRLKLKSGA